MKRLILWFVCSAAAFAQSLTVTAPATNATITGSNGNNVTLYNITHSNVPVNTCKVSDYVDNQLVGSTYSAPWALAWNPSTVMNSTVHFVQAKAFDCTNTLIPTTGTSAQNTGITIDNPRPVPLSQAQLNITPPACVATQNCSGSITYQYQVVGPRFNIVQIRVLMDGQDIQEIYGAPDQNFHNLNALNTTQYPNGPHDFRVIIMDTSGSAYTPGVGWGGAGVWTSPNGLVLANGHTAMDLVLSAQPLHLCTTSLTNCPTSQAITGQIRYTDGVTPTAASFSSVSIASSVPVAGIVSLGCTSSCGSSVTLTQGGVGSGLAKVTFTDNGTGFTRTLYANVDTANTQPHFGNDGKKYLTYTPGKSIWVGSQFSASNAVRFNGADPNYPVSSTFIKDYAAAGLKAMEVQPLPGPVDLTQPSQNWNGPYTWSMTQAQFTTNMTNYATAWSTIMSSVGVLIKPSQNLYKSNDVWLGTRSPGMGAGASPWANCNPGASIYSGCLWAIAASKWVGNGILWRIGDEQNIIWNSYPYSGPLAIGSTLFPGPIACTTSPNVCTVNVNTDALANGVGARPFVLRCSTGSPGSGQCPHTAIYNQVAQITANVTGGSITGYNIVSGGGGYETAPTLLPVCSGTTPTPTAVMTNGAVSSITGGTGGSGCSGVVYANGQGPFYGGPTFTSSTVTFTNPGLGTVNITSATDPGLVLDNLITIEGWGDANGNYADNNGVGCLIGCSDYIRGDAFSTVDAAWRSIANYPPKTMGQAGGRSQASQRGAQMPPQGDWNDVYFPVVDSDYTHWQSLFPLISDTYDVMQSDYGEMGGTGAGDGRQNPLIAQGATANVAVAQGPTYLSVSSCAPDAEGTLVTFSSPHGIGTVLPANTRFSISGSSSAACDFSFYVIDTPTALTAHVAYAQPQFTGSFSDSGNPPTTFANYANGTSWHVTSIGTNPSGFIGTQTTWGWWPSDGCATAEHGQILTFSSSLSLGPFAGTKWWDVPTASGFNNDAVNCYAKVMAQVPTAITSTGGTAALFPSNDYTLGQSYILLGNYESELGPRMMYTQMTMATLMPGGAGTEAYPQTFVGFPDDATNGATTRNFVDGGVNQSCSGGGGTAAHPVWWQCGNAYSWTALYSAMHWNNFLVPWIYCSRASSPDYGQWFISALRVGCAAGNALLIDGFVTDSTNSATVDLTASWASGCGNGGQNFILYRSGWAGIQVSSIAAGTASTTITFDGDTVITAAVVCPAAGYQWSAPVISAKLSSVTNASKLIVRYAYNPYVFRSPISDMATVQTVDCGSGTCTLPADPRIAPITYQLQYLNSSGTPIATGGLQTLPQQAFQ